MFCRAHLCGKTACAPREKSRCLVQGLELSLLGGRESMVAGILRIEVRWVRSQRELTVVEGAEKPRRSQL